MSRGTLYLAAWLAANALALPLAAQDLEAGKATYEKWCSQCHGENGDGQGIATRFVKPEPRDFTSGKYKIRMTPTGQLPTDADIERAIRRGLPFTAMPPFEANMISDAELRDLVAYIKSFAPAFAEAESAPEPITIPTPPAYDPAFATSKGREVYEQTGCAACHGNLGRGDGFSAATLKDDWGNHIRAADLSKPWTFRGGGTREDIFRTMSTGFAGTPMPGFHGALPPEDIWAITDYMLSLSGGPQGTGIVEAPYATMVTARATGEPIDLDNADALFEGVSGSLFPLLGQIIEPGRDFYPSATGIEVKAVYNQDDILFRLIWNDMKAEEAGSNAPDLAVPSWDEQLAAASGGDDAAEDDPWGADDPWGDAADDDTGADDPWGDDAIDEASDPWGDDAVADSDDGDDFWGDAGDGGDDGSASGDEGFSDAVAIQFEQQPSGGVRKPYFIFGDAQNAVDLWFADLAKKEGELWAGRGSNVVTPGDGTAPEVRARYEEGAWIVDMKRERSSRAGASFEPSTFMPVAFSVWDGFNEERGNKRALTAWWDLYLEPLERPSPTGPAIKAFLGLLALELLIVGIVRWRKRRRTNDSVGSPAAQTA